METIITNNHHFCEGIVLTLQNGNLKWSIDSNKQKFKYGTGVRSGASEFRDGVLDPKNNLDDFIKLLNLVFEFTGTITNICYNKTLISPLQISDSNLSTKNVVEMIYNMKLEHEIKFVKISTCGCNMGYCSAVTGVNIKSKTYKTYGEVMSIFGYEATIDGFTYYEYPDSVLLNLNRITEIPSEIIDYKTHNPIKNENIKLDQDTVYLSYAFSR